MIILLRVGLTTRYSIHEWIIPKLTRLAEDVKVELDLSNYVTKTDSKDAAGVDILKLAKRVDLASLHSQCDKFDIGELENTRLDLSNLSDGVKNQVVEKTVYDQLVKNINAINTTDTSQFVKETWEVKKNTYLNMTILNILLFQNLIS